MDLNVRNESCTDCALFIGCRSVCLSATNKVQSDLMVVFDYPSITDDKGRTVMLSNREKLLFEVAEKVAEVDLRLAAKAYLVRCTPDKRKPTDEEFEACFKYLEQEVAAIKPKVILCCGDATFQKLVPGNKKFMASVGQAFKVNIGGHDLLVVPTFSPFYVSQNTARLTDFATHIQKAYHISVGFAGSGKNVPYVLCDTISKVEELMDYCKQTGRAAFDFESTGLDVHDPTFRATCLSISFQSGSSYVVPLDHFETPFKEDELEKVFCILTEQFFAKPNIDKIAHNLKYDMHVARSYGLWPIKGRLDDTMLMHHLIDETTKQGLKILAPMYYPEYQDYEGAIAAYGWDAVPLDELAQYSANDTDLTIKLRDIFENKLLEDIRLYRIYRNLTIPALKALQDVEYMGARIDKEFLEASIIEAQKISDEIQKDLLSIKEVARYIEFVREDLKQEKVSLLEQKIKAEKAKKKPIQATIDRLTLQKNAIKTGSEVIDVNFNFGSWVQLQPLLYSSDGFGFPKLARPKRGETDMPTNKAYLLKLDDPSGFIQELLAWRSVNKILSTYLKGIHERLDPQEKVHTSFLLHGTVTGRLSSSNPNLQNIPKVAKVKHEKARKVTKMVTKCFIPPAGMEIIQVDYSQAELRLMAEFSEDENMIEAYRTDKDLHALTGSTLADMSLEDFYKLAEAVMKDIRTKAKAGNFGLIYGMSPEGFMEYAYTNYGVKLTLEEAQKFRQKFFRLYPRILEYHELYKAKARKFGYVRTLFGRKRHCDDINSEDDFKRGMAEREAINSPIQGTAGEMTVFGISLLYVRFKAAGIRCLIFNTVHDSIQIYGYPEDRQAISSMVERALEDLPIMEFFKKELKHVTMKVDFEASPVSWGDLQEFKIT